MKNIEFKAGVALTAVLFVCFGALVLGTASMLPENVASHFGIGGEPNGWMAKRGFLTFMLGFGLGMPLLITGLFALITVLPRAVINLPNKDYWLSPEQMQTTRRWMINSGLWLSSLLLLLLVVTYWLVVQANRSEPVRLDETGLLIVLGLFLLGVLGWAIRFLRRFSRPGIG
jgi:uncharacterized membrane protein